MRNSSDPAAHQRYQQDMIGHVERLLTDDRLRVDTTTGRRPVPSLSYDLIRKDRARELKQMMGELGINDPEMEGRMPLDLSLEIGLYKRKLLLMKEAVGRLRVFCVSPWRALLKGEEPKPLSTTETQQVLTRIYQPASVPVTLVLMSSSGFTLESHEVAERRSDRTLILAEPNDVGGWNLVGPIETKSLVDLFDPESDESKRKRIDDAVAAGQINLLNTGLSSDRIAAQTRLPLQYVEIEMKAYAQRENGLVAKRVDGRIVLFRQNSVAS